MKYIIYRDHMGLVITTDDDYEALRQIFVAVQCATWGEFMAAMPAWERRCLLEQYGTELFGSDFVAWKDTQEEAEMKDSLVYRDTPFDPHMIPAFDDGDWPFWPANPISVSDDVCAQAFRRFGTLERGAIQAMYHLRDDAVPEVEAWLATQGHTLEVKEDPNGGRY